MNVHPPPPHSHWPCSEQEFIERLSQLVPDSDSALRESMQPGLEELFLTPVHFEWPLCEPTELTVAGRLPGPVSFLFAYAWVPLLVAKTFLHSPFKLCTRVISGVTHQRVAYSVRVECDAILQPLPQHCGGQQRVPGASVLPLGVKDANGRTTYPTVSAFVVNSTRYNWVPVDEQGRTIAVRANMGTLGRRTADRQHLIESSVPATYIPPSNPLGSSPGGGAAGGAQHALVAAATLTTTQPAPRDFPTSLLDILDRINGGELKGACGCSCGGRGSNDRGGEGQPL